MTVTIALICLVFLAVLAYRVRILCAQAPESARRSGVFVSSSSLLLFSSDCVLLGTLDLWHVSYGKIGTALASLLCVRLLLFLIWLVRWQKDFVPSLKGGAGSGQTMRTAAVLGLNLLITLSVVDAFYYEPFAVELTTLQIAPAGASGATTTLRLVQISDLHVERITRREEELVEMVKRIDPDFIVFTGDYVNLEYLSDPLALQAARSVISRLHAKQGIFAIRGNTDSPELTNALFAALNITVLEDQIAAIPGYEPPLFVAGMGVHSMDRTREVLARLMADVPAQAYTILLSHKPDLIEAASGTRINLYLSGHTHGGQIRLPFYGAIVTFSAFGKRYEQGLYNVGSTTLYVSRGLGMEGFFWSPRARFFCHPEVVQIELKVRAVQDRPPA